MSETALEEAVVSTTLPVISAGLAAKINSLRNRRRDGESFDVESILVTSLGLDYGKLTAVLIGGFGPDKFAPPVYIGTASASDLVGGVYLHPRFPAWYHRSEFIKRSSDLRITRFLESELGTEFDPSNPHFVMWAIMQIYG